MTLRAPFTCSSRIFSAEVPRSKLALFAIALSMLVLSGCSEKPEHQAIVKSVNVLTPQSTNASVERTLSGVLHPVDQSVLSFEMPGVVQSIEVNLGDRFEKGQPLASIEDRVFDLAVKQRQGQLSEAKARLTEAELDYKRKLQLANTGAVSQADIDVAKARYDSLIDQVNIAETQVSLALEDLADTVLKAPFSGSVAQRHVEPSQQVSPTTPILTIQGSDALEVSVLVPESMISQIDMGDEVSVEVLIDRQRQRLAAEVFELGKQAQRANAFPITVKLNDGQNTDGLQPGMSAEVRFSLISESNTASPTSNQTLLRAPLSAVAAGAQNAHYIYLLEPSEQKTHRLRQIPVDVLAFHAKEAVFTPQESLPENAQIVAAGLDFLREGQQVHIANTYPLTINE